MEKVKQNILPFTFFLVGLSLVYYFFIDPFKIFQQTVFYNFQARDIDRARQILNGHFLFYGPEMTGGGNLPGPLYYLTLAIGQFFNSTWKSAWVIEFIFIFLGGIMGSLFFLKQKKSASFIWLALFSSAPLTAWFIKIFLNTSLLIPFVVFCLIASKAAFLENNKRSNLLYYFAFLSVGLGIQYHFSIICLLPGLFIANYLFDKKFSNKQMLLGFLVFLAPSLPHLTWLLFRKLNMPFGIDAFYSGDADQSIVSIIYLIKLNFSIISLNLFKSWLLKILTSFPFSFFPLLLTTLIFRNKISKSTKLLIIFLVCSFPPYFNWYFSGQAIRYTIPFYICLLFTSTELITNVLDNKNQRYFFTIISFILLLVGIYFVAIELNNFELKNLVNENAILIILIIILFNKKTITHFTYVLSIICIFTTASLQKELIGSDRVFNSKSQEGYMLNYEEWSKIANIIYTNTGKNFEYYKYKTYYIGHHVNQFPLLALSGFEYNPAKLNSSLIEPDGFIISNRFGNLSANRKRNSKNPLGWILRQNIHSDFKEAIEKNYITIGENLSNDKLVVPYYVTNTFEFPKHFHNLSAGYNISNEDLELETIKKNGVLKIDDNHYLLKWNENPDQSSYCSTGIKIDLSKFRSEKIILTRIIGATLSQITPWISPNWTQSWDEPFLEATCDSKTIKIKLVESIGFNRKYSHRASVTPFFAGNNSFSAPFERSIKLNCSGALSSITIGRKGSTIDMITSTKQLPAQSLTINFTEGNKFIDEK